MRRTNCPNCGAPIEHYYNYQCPYCKTFLYNTEPNEETERIDIDRYDIRLDGVVIEKAFLHSGFLLTLYCTAYPKLQGYFQEETCIAIEKPKQCGCCIIFDATMVRNLRISSNPLAYLLHILKTHIPPYILESQASLDKIIESVRDCEYIGKGLDF